MKDTSIGQRIKQRRKELGLTQAAVHQQIGISAGNLSDYERDDKLPSALSLLRLSEALDCTTDWILKGTETATTNQEMSPHKNLYHVLEMYLYLDEDDQKEIDLLLKYKYNKKEDEKKALLSSLLKGTNAE